jgi:hypothetical protein
MTTTRSRPASILAAAALSALTLSAPAGAQPGGWGPGLMMGPGMMMGSAMCGPRAAGLAEWRMELIERAVRPTDAQRPAINDLKAASAKAAEIITAACPRDFP